MKPRIKEVIVVEGRYDRNALAQVVDATVVETGGFSVFNNREKLAFLRRLAEKRGLILLTDPDGAGFVIRNHLKGAIPRQLLKQAYVPDIVGKERRKRHPGKEGKLGVEGMRPEVLLEALRRCGATLEGEDAPAPGGADGGGGGGEYVRIGAVAGEGGDACVRTGGDQDIIVLHVVELVPIVEIHRAHGTGEDGELIGLAKEREAGVHRLVLTDGIHVETKCLPRLILSLIHI